MRSSSRPPFATGAALVIAAVLSAGAPACGTAGPAADDDARDQLLERLDRGASATWGLTARFHRETPAGPLDARLERLNRPPDSLTAGFGSLHGVWEGRTLNCANGPEGKLCGPTAVVDPSVRAPTSVEALRAATGRRGTARVRHDGTFRVDGRTARCYAVAPRRGGTVPSAVAQYCLTSDGIPLRTRVRREDSSDVTTTEEVRRNVTDADFERLLRGYPIGPPP